MTEPDDRTVFYGGLPTDHLLVPAPVVYDPANPEPFTLRDWLVHYNPHRDNAWPHVVGRFYAEAAQMPSIASFFAGVDMAGLQRHFTAMLMIVSHHGLTVGTVERMREAHGSVRDEAGRPITTAVYDDVVSVLAGVLAREGVPFSTIKQLARTVLPLRDAIAVPNRGDDTGPIPAALARFGDPDGRSCGCRH